MKKKLHLIFAFIFILFASANMCGQIIQLSVSKTDISCNSSTGSITADVLIGMFPPYTYNWSNGATTKTISNLSAGNYSLIVKDAINSTAIANVTINAYLAKAIAVQTNASCGGASSGSATVAVKGGSGTYSYSWNTQPVQTTQSVTGLAAGIYTVTVKDLVTSCITTSNVDINLNPTTPVGDPAIYGDNIWNVYAWNEGTFNNRAWTSDYSGYFTANTLSFNSEDYFEDYDTPSSASGYQGCRVNGDNHSWSAKRQGFPCGYYKIDIPMHDDWVRLYINDQIVFQDNNCCESHTNVWEGFLTSNSKVEFRIAEDRGQSRGNIKFNLIEPTAVITNVKCNGGNDGAINLTPETNGIYTYNWGNGITTKDRTGLAAGNYIVVITTPAGCTETKTYTVAQPAVLKASQDTFVNPGCNGGTNGSATVAVSGGTLPYNYLWSPSGGTGITASGLSDGTYTVTVTDGNNCTATQSFTLTEPTPLAVTTSQIDVLCHGNATGSASVIVSGGTPGYSYSWAPAGGNGATASNLTAGTYTVTITDKNNCLTTRAFTIIEPLNPLATSEGTIIDVSCHGEATGSATVNVTGGTGSYSYSWAPSGGTKATASGMVAGSYVVTVKDDNGCTTTQGFSINEPASGLSATTASVKVSCFGGANGSASVDVSGGSPNYSYFWAPSGGTGSFATGLTAGDYTCTITDSKGCTLTKTITVETSTQLSGTIAKVNVSCNGGSNGSATVTPSGGVGSYSYVWAPTGGNAATASGLAQGTYSVTIKDGNACVHTESVTINEPPVLTASITHTDVLCNGGATGTATVVPMGGTDTYSYAWSPAGGSGATATGLATGSYSCLITDSNGCFIMKSITIGEPAVLSATAAQINATCSLAGQASVTVSGGVSPYTYSWTPSGQTSAIATGLTAGNYSCLITDDNGCTLSKSFIIITTNTLTAVATQNDVLCNGASTGSASVVPSGAPGPFTYVWGPSGGASNTASNLVAGNYSVTITSANGCSIVKNITITQPSALVVTPSQTNVLCHGGTTGSARASVTGGSGAYTYSWAPYGGSGATASELGAGTYTVTVTDANSCTTTQSFIITEPALLEVLTSQTNVSCDKGNNGAASVNVSGGKEPYSYTWSSNGPNKATADELTAGTYTITVVDANSCSITKTVVIEEPAPYAVNTFTATNLTVSGAVVSGTVSSEKNDGKCLTEAGFVYSLKSNPLATDNKIVAGSALGPIASTLTDLKGNTTYYVKTYAINSNGFIAYGNEISFTTEKYTLYITASAGQKKVFGTTDPVFKYTVSGFANGDTNAIINGNLSREAGENVGKYNIQTGTINAGADYKIVFESALFEITKADQMITWNQDLKFGCGTENEAILNAVSNSGLLVVYSVTNPGIAAISGNNLTVKKSGSTSITAFQNGDQNYNPAVAVIKPIEVTQDGLITQHWSDVLFFDNNNKDFVSWQWYKNGIAISGATKQYFGENQVLNGAYYVIATDKEGNLIKSCLFEIAGEVFSKKLKIYPNPVKTSSEFTLECNFSEPQLKGAVINIFDINGKLVQTVSNVKTQNQIVAPSQTAIYVVSLTLLNGEQKTINLLVH